MREAFGRGETGEAEQIEEGLADVSVLTDADPAPADGDDEAAMLEIEEHAEAD